MRLFFAIRFDDAVLGRLTETQNLLRRQTLRGNFTFRDNLHLTLVFLGEVPPSGADGLLRAKARADFTPLELEIRGVGRFKRDGGDIVWAGIEKSAGLQAAYGRLSKTLEALGYPADKRPYSPHLTLAREAVFRPGFDLAAFSEKVPPIKTRAEKLSLMKSERCGGRLTYTELG